MVSVPLLQTAKFKELAPYDDDWYYTRVSAVARHIYMRSPVGVGSVQKIFGGKERALRLVCLVVLIYAAYPQCISWLV